METSPHIDICAYQIPGDRVLVVSGVGQHEDVPVPEDAQDDPDTFDEFIVELARRRGITQVRDTDGNMVTVLDWLKRGGLPF